MIRSPPGLRDIERILRAAAPAVIAVSGGVDSMTLAYLAMGAMIRPPLLVHAISPAVPADATARVRHHAERKGWALQCLDAGEFSDTRYVANPVDRCYFCKTNLYRALRRDWLGPLFSGTNCDDLSDFRPGLMAAAEHEVRHPFVEAGIHKAEVRAIAAYLNLQDLADLPAQPCLSSRIETGIPIDARRLAVIDRLEARLRATVGEVDIRCRQRRTGLHVEIEL